MCKKIKRSGCVSKSLETANVDPTRSSLRSGACRQPGGTYTPKKLQGPWQERGKERGGRRKEEKLASLAECPDLELFSSERYDFGYVLDTNPYPKIFCVSRMLYLSPAGV